MKNSASNKQRIKIQKQRALIKKKLREFFEKKGFLEVQTPTFAKLPGMEPYLNPLPYEFQDERNKKFKGYVVTSPEYSLKKLLSRGYPKIFELARVFRQNESFGGTHNPEFTMLEWYRPHSNYKKIMQDCEELISFLAISLHRKPQIKFNKKIIDLTPPWPKLSVKDAFKKFADINLDNCQTLDNFQKETKSKFPKSYSWDDIFYYIFLNQIEPNLPENRPIFIYEYPLPQASLAKKKSPESFYAERFELFIAGMEIANAFSELTDWQEQEKRLKEERRLRQKLGKDDYEIDQDFIEALKQGLPETGGIALGVERLEMLLLNIQEINNLMILPMKKLFG